MKNKSRELKKLKKQVKGITLIALVVTIIVLLILAGVALNLTIGDNGLFKRAQNAVDTWQMAEINEQKEMDKAMDELDNYLKPNIERVNDDNPGELEGDGTEETPYTINSIEDLVYFSYDVTNGNNYEGKTVKLGANLDFDSNKSYINAHRTDYEKYGYGGDLKKLLTSGMGFKPIGLNGTKNFAGTFDGNNKVIYSLFININGDTDIRAGLFSTSEGIIKNLGLANVNISVNGIVIRVGGIVGESYNSMYNCYVTGNINAIGNSWMGVGGLCGEMKEEGNIENSYNFADIECKNIKEEYGKADISCGGIVGQGYTNINKCFNRGNLKVNGEKNQVFAGGIVGFPKMGTIKNSYNCAKIEAISETSNECYVGGIAGMSASSSIMYCYNLGQIIGEAENLFIGGIISRQGDRDVTIKNVFNIGEITIKNQNVNTAGGIIGQVASEEWHADIYDSYNVGDINVENPTSIRVGSFAGNNSGNTISFYDCYYLTGTYEEGVGYGDNTGLTELQEIQDFPTVFEVVNGEGAFLEDRENKNDGYPLLRIN